MPLSWHSSTVYLTFSSTVPPQKFASRIIYLALCTAMPAIAAFRIVGAVDDDLAALGAVGAEVIQSFQVAAFALPVPDGVFDEFQRGGAPEVINGEYRVENGLQPHIFAFRRRNVHLQKRWYDFLCTSIKLGMGMPVWIFAKSMRSRYTFEVLMLVI